MKYYLEFLINIVALMILACDMNWTCQFYTFNLLKYFHVWMISDMLNISCAWYAHRRQGSKLQILKSNIVLFNLCGFLSISWATHPFTYTFLLYTCVHTSITNTSLHRDYGPLTLKYTLSVLGDYNFYQVIQTVLIDL